MIGDVPDVHEIQSNKAEYEQEGKVELMRRGNAVHRKMGENHCLYSLIVRCLHDKPEQRPSIIDEIRNTLRGLCEKYPNMVSSQNRCEHSFGCASTEGV